MKNLSLCILIAILIAASKCGDLHFGRTQICVDSTVTPCQKWNSTVQLSYYYGFSYYMCFPA